MSLQRITSRIQRFWRGAALAAAGLSAVVSGAAYAGDAKTQYFPLATFRVGAYASSGIPVWAGEIDYFRYINEVEGGINGIKLVWDECETNWEVEKGVECYERVKGGKNGSPVPIFLPHGDPISKALTEKSVADRSRSSPSLMAAPRLSTDGCSRTASRSCSAWSEASSAINYIAQREGGKDKLKGLKIATVYHD